jgi:hypothetical protein
MSILENAGNTTIESNGTPGAVVNLVSGGNSVRRQYFTYAQSKSAETDSDWMPVAAEARGGRITMAIKFTSSDPNEDWLPLCQAVDYTVQTGALLGLHLHDEGYVTGEEIKRSVMSGAPDPYQQSANFGPEREKEFLARFDWIINPESSHSSSNPANVAISAPSAYSKDNADIITNYNPKGKDKLQIELSTFDGAVGKLNITKKTKQVTKLAKKDVDLIYDQQAGYLYYNENGKQPGFGNGGILAILEGKPKAGLGNFEFV